jgi:hypothetical protein
MKKLIISLLIAGLSSLNFDGLSQSPVGFPTGIVVGTGVSIPSGSSYKMAVGGGIITEKIRVATNGTAFWADYVFESNFKLRSLSEVAQYIKLNKHLPDIPSTAEVSQNGIDLAETQALLLQKVEELTLYVIEQDKQIKKLEKKVRTLSQKNKL